MVTKAPASSYSTAPRKSAGNSRTRRLLGRWWREQSPARQDRFATLGPLISVMLFLAAIVAAFWYLRNEEIERERESVKRDTEVVQQQIRLRLIENQEQLTRIAREVAAREVDQGKFLEQASSFVQTRPEIVSLSWTQADRSIKASQVSPNASIDSGHPLDMPITPSGTAGSTLTMPPTLSPEFDQTFSAAREQRQPVYSAPHLNAMDTPVIQVHVPLIDRKGFAGTLVAEYSVEALLRYLVPSEIANRHVMSLVEYSGKVMASTVIGGADGDHNAIVHEVVITPVGNGLILRGEGSRTSFGVIGNTLFWMVMALSALTVWMLLGTWRHMRRRTEMQRTLMQETNFRRAMENSMLTGLRVIDGDGRITYVNPAFCAMTGFAEDELVGRLPPYPYWPLDRVDESSRLFQQEIQGRSPAGGVEVQIMRKDGSKFDARMYVSPLIDAQGQQTGWMSSVTNITEAKRVRDQLSAAHERFTTVLESLDAAVSVVSVQQGDLLFANRSYRLWFGVESKGHTVLAGDVSAPADSHDHTDLVDSFGGLPTQQITDAGSDTREVHVESLQKWFEVRTRYIQWTDGRLAQMLIATDITTRRKADEVAAQQADRAQVTSRLITMGEMASSVAHELNQPLAAISNYCAGIVSRVKARTIEPEDLVGALEKTARQAQRAGQIIHRIRSFVKRSEPQRQPARAREIVEDAVELASIALRRRKILIHTYVAPRLPPLLCDPILIEQVLLNLLKNAAEAIDNAGLPTSRRRIEVRVVQRAAEEGEVVEFTVTDNGPGIAQEVIDRLFEAFFSTKSDGMGIGLSLCRSIIESHRGRLRAENLYNGPDVAGCRFTFTLPVEDVDSLDPSTRTDPPLDLIADSP